MGTEGNEDLKKKLEEVEKLSEERLNSWKRSAADFENYKKRREKEDAELVIFAKELTVARLLPILDSLEQALRHMPVYPSSPAFAEASADRQPSPARGEGEDPSTRTEEGVLRADEGKNDFVSKYKPWQEGINVMLKQLDKTLEELGVKKIEALGKKFDPFRHEAVRHVEGEEDDVVVEEVQSGFELNGKVIRPSQVVVSKKVKK